MGTSQTGHHACTTILNQPAVLTRRSVLATLATRQLLVGRHQLAATFTRSLIPVSELMEVG